MSKPVFSFSFSDQPGVTAGISTRIGGHSTGPYSAFNLGLSSGEDKETVHRNRRIFAEEMGIDPDRMVFGFQCHGSEIATVSAPCEFMNVDGFLTEERGLLLNVSVADCFPVLFSDSHGGLTGAVHCGWRGTVAGIHKKMAGEFSKRLKNLSRTEVIIGPGIRHCHFEVGRDVAEKIPEKFLSPAGTDGKFWADLPGLIRSDLIAEGVSETNVHDSGICTYCREDLFYSFRRDQGVTGRMMAGILRV